MIEFKLGMLKNREVKEGLKSLSAKLSNLQKPMAKAGIIMLSSIDENFEQEGRPEKWKPIAPITKAFRRKKSDRILQDTGQLRRSITMRPAADGMSVKVGTSQPHAYKLQFGGIASGISPYVIVPKKKKALHFNIGGREIFARRVQFPGLSGRRIPPRPFVMMQNEDMDKIHILFKDYIDKIITEMPE